MKIIFDGNLFLSECQIHEMVVQDAEEQSKDFLEQ